MADYLFARLNFYNIDIHTDFLAVYKYATENDINESCMDSPVYYPEFLHPCPWEPSVGFPPRRYEIDPCSLEVITVVPPSYNPYPRAAIRMAPTSTGELVDLGQNPHYDEPKYCPGFGPLNYFIRPTWSIALDKNLSLARELGSNGRVLLGEAEEER